MHLACRLHTIVCRLHTIIDALHAGIDALHFTALLLLAIFYIILAITFSSCYTAHNYLRHISAPRTTDHMAKSFSPNKAANTKKYIITLLTIHLCQKIA